jgi:hypothetical protein
MTGPYLLRVLRYQQKCDVIRRKLSNKGIPIAPSFTARQIERQPKQPLCCKKVQG